MARARAETKLNAVISDVASHRCSATQANRSRTPTAGAPAAHILRDEACREGWTAHRTWGRPDDTPEEGL